MNQSETELLLDLRSLADPDKAKILQRFFKTGPGEYAEGDIFWGITVPAIRNLVRRYRILPLSRVEELLRHPVHEVRLCALLILVQNAAKQPETAYLIYLRNTAYINNWDLVDLSAEHVVGAYLEGREPTVLKLLAGSASVWERRIAMLSTFHFIKKGDAALTLEIAALLLHDKHDLIHKAVGWMLREVGKRCSPEAEEVFLRAHAAAMPRTMLRYAIERFPAEKRAYYLSLKTQALKA